MFYHLHLHSVYSVLDGMCKLQDLVDLSQSLGLDALAITDHGTMSGCAQLHELCAKNKIKPLYGCEMYVARRGAAHKSTQEDRSGNHLILIAKNEEGYRNLCRLNSLSYETRNFYYKPRIDFEMLQSYNSGLICLSACLAGAVPEEILKIACADKGLIQTILNNLHTGIDIKTALTKIKTSLAPYMKLFSPVMNTINRYQSLFGDDYYLELQRHANGKGITQLYSSDKEPSLIIKQLIVNGVLLNLDLNRYVATNDVHFLRKEDAHSHDIQICISTKRTINDATDKMSYSGEEYFKTEAEMSELFDAPELEKTREIVEKVEFITPTHEAQMPAFSIPTGFKDEADYLKHLVYQGATELYIKEQPEVSYLLEESNESHFTLNLDTSSIVKAPFPLSSPSKGFFFEDGLLFSSFSSYSACLLCSAWVGQQHFVERKKHIEEVGGDFENIKSFLKKFVVFPYSDNIRNFCLANIKRFLSKETINRIEFELNTIFDMGFPGYFLIMWDLIRACREELNTLVGPGRGSAAGSIIAYCLHITRLDPLKYDLLFERFLNPDRISLPDIDTDFEPTQRENAIAYAQRLYGEKNVSHIITFSTLAPKSTLADVVRVYDQPLYISNELKGLIPKNLDNFKSVNGTTPALTIRNCCKYVPTLKNLYEGKATEERYQSLSKNPYIQDILNDSINIEGIIRGVGVHACGIIIGKSDLSNFVPMATVEDKDFGRISVTQYDGHYIENMGLIKMDFLGIDNLTVIQKCIQDIQRIHPDTKLDFYNLPLDDKETYELFQRGETIGIFQFESDGMQTYLKKLQPTEFADLIAMNALYRPGPMAYIPQYIERKHGASFEYQLPCMEKYLKDTYGITIYQEQVMLLSREIAGFSRGESDTLRKAMGKKKKDLLDGLYSKFMEGGTHNHYDKAILDKIWKDWMNFASYAFNKSHAACYAYVAYATAFLKTHYKAVFLSACLSVFGNDRKKITKFIKDAKNNGIHIVLPDINLAEMEFTSYSENGKDYILFGLKGLKGLGEGIIEAIIAERNKKGPFKDIFDFAQRMDASSCGKKTFEILTYAGAFDNFGKDRNYYLGKTNSKEDFFDTLIKWSTKTHENTNQSSLFGKKNSEITQRPEVTMPNHLSKYELLNNERELVGMFVSEHLLDTYLFELKHLCNFSVEDLIYFDNIKNATDRKNMENASEENTDTIEGTEDLQLSNDITDKFSEANEWINQHKNNIVKFAAVVSNIQDCVSKNMTNYKKISIDGYEDSFTFPVFKDQFDNLSLLFQKDSFVYITAVIQQKNKGKKWFKELPTEEADFECRFTDVQPLEVIQDELIDSISLTLNVNQINEPFIRDLSTLCESKSGDITLSFQLDDGQQRLQLINNNIKIHIDREFYNFFTSHNLPLHIRYRKVNI